MLRLYVRLGTIFCWFTIDESGKMPFLYSLPPQNYITKTRLPFHPKIKAGAQKGLHMTKYIFLLPTMNKV